MRHIHTLIKWPGGKAREIPYIEEMIPSFDRYVEPFFGGGALFFHLKPKAAIINDISEELTDFYRLVKEQNPAFHRYLEQYCELFETAMHSCDAVSEELLTLFHSVQGGRIDDPESELKPFADRILEGMDAEALRTLVPDHAALRLQLTRSALDKLVRTVKNDEKRPYSDADLRENLVTGFASGIYLYFRELYNDIALNRRACDDPPFRAANFYFVREYCYGSMFRYNRQGEFNIPYGGMSYNRKDFRAKVRAMFQAETEDLFSNTEIHCGDFESFLNEIALTERDFVFLDPPYDSDFSDYEGRAFTREDQKRLAEALKGTKAGFILIIKNTPFIHSLYEDHFRILRFDKTYTYNVRSRNERNTEHLIITNLPETKTDALST